MNLDADMVRDKPDNTLAVSGAHGEAGVANPLAQPVDPQASVRVQHHLDDGSIVEPFGDRRPKRRAQHPRAAGASFGTERMDTQQRSPEWDRATAARLRGSA